MKILKNKKVKYILAILVIAIFFGYLFLNYEKEDIVDTPQEEKQEVAVVEEVIEENYNFEVCQSGSKIIFLDRDNEKYRTEDKEIYSVFSDGVFYTWNSQNADGKKFSVECMNSLNMEPDNDSDEEDEKQFEDFLDFKGIVAISKNCKKYAKKVNFSPSENIGFKDYCELLKNQINLLKGL